MSSWGRPSRSQVLIVKMILTVATGWAVMTATTLAQTSSSPSFILDDQSFNSVDLGSAALESTGYSLARVTAGGILAPTTQSSESYVFDPGFGATYPPPGEVAGSCSAVASDCLVFSGLQDLGWPAEKSAGTYNLYRALLSEAVSSGFGACEQTAISGITTSDSDPVPVGDGFFYLITVLNRLGEEGTKGVQSGAVSRPNKAPCP